MGSGVSPRGASYSPRMSTRAGSFPAELSRQGIALPAGQLAPSGYSTKETCDVQDPRTFPKGTPLILRGAGNAMISLNSSLPVKSAVMTAVEVASMFRVRDP